MAQSIYDIELMDLAGEKAKLIDYKGKVLLIVNIASKCGLTPQLKGLEILYEKYRNQGFEILAFPSNDFYQEPKAAESISQFCQQNYGITFRIFSKGRVKGNNAQPLYKYLASNSKIGFINNAPLWNFHKYLIGRHGQIADYFLPWTQPLSDKISDRVKKCLAERAVNN